ncbi:MAG: cytochrome c biogenesis protein CcdA [Clostridium sp.]|uniref:cytochrome c biogenesis protein/redoxin n=1 Tax=Clostridium sp. TaxID=1506 RepID=UPI002FC682B5
MFENIVSAQNISFVLVFFEGLVSFLSPCVIPLLPIYITYLAGNAKVDNGDGTYRYIRSKVLLHTVFFILGISTAFFLLGLSFTALGGFLADNRDVFGKVAGIIIILLGVVQLGIIKPRFMQRERKINLNIAGKKMNPLLAYVIGFTFSFAWTPCVGPALSSVLILASSASSSFVGNMLVLVYAIGFVIPFLLLGLFTSQVLNFFKNNKKFMKYSIKVGAVIMIIIGVMTFTGVINNVTNYLGGSTKPPVTSTDKKEEDKTPDEVAPPSEDPRAPMEFTMKDQYGKTHRLSDYKGKTVFINFWATWCPPCRKEMPHIEEIYKEYGLNKNEVVILTVITPNLGREGDRESIIKYAKEQGYTMPILFDEEGTVAADYRISAYPTTFMINKDYKVYGYVSGGLEKDQMKEIITQTQNGKIE